MVILKDYSNSKISQKLGVEMIKFPDDVFRYIMNMKEVSGMRYYE